MNSAIYEMRNIHLGQGHDLRWSYHTEVPSLQPCIHMVDGKTGGFLRLVTRLMSSEATVNQQCVLHAIQIIEH
ncbi:hypothetical protein N7493_005489 [Penicillium malachiteum]|uniref:Uncharacterized protein n=1 Tax=Penicillium malachiteum TaxID=1324776 RepID=A0AAD6HNH4_9EURO|nr:hypothetical protein N7493_005489 [Penicillium malachiteum]